mgnify:CR=1 FL=1
MTTKWSDFGEVFIIIGFIGKGTTYIYGFIKLNCFYLEPRLKETHESEPRIKSFMANHDKVSCPKCNSDLIIDRSMWLNITNNDLIKTNQLSKDIKE